MNKARERKEPIQLFAFSVLIAVVSLTSCNAAEETAGEEYFSNESLLVSVQEAQPPGSLQRSYVDSPLFFEDRLNDWLCEFNQRCDLGALPVGPRCQPFLKFAVSGVQRAVNDTQATREFARIYEDPLFAYLEALTCNDANQLFRSSPLQTVLLAFVDPEWAERIVVEFVSNPQDDDRQVIAIQERCGDELCVLGEQHCIRSTMNEGFSQFCADFVERGGACNLDYEVLSLSEWRACGPQLFCQEGTCRQAGETGDSCTELPCANGLRCVREGHSMTCVEQTVGIAFNQDCVPGIRTCTNGAYCQALQEGAGRCQPRRQLGETCEQSQHCPIGSFCSSGICEEAL